LTQKEGTLVDLQKLTPGEITTAVSGVLLLVFSFFKWFGVSIGGIDFDVNRTGWQSPGAFWSIVAILLGIVLAAHVIVEKLTGVDLPDRLGSVGWGVTHLAGGAIAVVFLLLKWITKESGWDTKIGFWLGLLSAIGLLVGGYLMAKEAGELPSALGGAKGDSTPPAA
jgi:hypothetical protein